MSEPKVQLVEPQGNMSVTGMSAVGVITASSFDGISNSSATGITGNPDLNLGIVTATSFVGQGKGHAAGLAGTPELNLGVTTATSFVGDATGKAAGLTGTPNLNVGLVTATGFAGNVTGTVTGNVTGLAVSITPGSNLGVGVCTAIQYHGDGSGLTGAGSSAYIAQNITATTGETIIDLSYGNLIYYKGEADTTVGFASTSPAEQITVIRDTDPTYDISYSTGGVDFDGTDDRLTLAASSDLAMGTGDFTIEMWVLKDDDGPDGVYQISADTGGLSTTLTGPGLAYHNNDGNKGWQLIAAGGHTDVTYPISDGAWYHIAHVRTGGSSKLYVNGVHILTKSDTTDYSTSNLCIGGYYSTDYLHTGKISNFRVVKGTALYTSNFVPPSAALTNVTNTKLLCCQSDSSTTTAAVTPGTITAVGDPTAGAETVALSGSLNATITWPSTVKWNNDTTPTLFSNPRSAAFQIFHLTTVNTRANYQAWEEMQNDSDDLALFMWGKNNNGGLGQNDTVQRSSPVQVPGVWKTLGGQSDSAYGGRHAIKNDNTLWAWGRNYRNSLGLNDNTSYSSPVQMPGTTWASITGAEATHATKTDGTLWSWGYGNVSGSQGQNDNTARNSPTQVGTDTDWSHVGKAGKMIQGIKTNGSLYIAGPSSSGRLGLNQGPGNNRSSPIQIPGSWSKAFQCSDYAAGLKTDGTYWGWASNSNGSLGQNDRTNQSSPVQIPGTWSDVAGAYNANGGVKTDGTLWTWGANNEGILGQNNTTKYSSPTQIPGTTWRSIDMGYGWTVASKTDNTLWAWGRNTDGGQLGDNTIITRSSPIQIPGLWGSGASIGSANAQGNTMATKLA